MVFIARIIFVLLTGTLVASHATAQDAKEPPNDNGQTMAARSRSMGIAGGPIVVGQGIGKTPHSVGLGGQLRLTYLADVSPNYGFFCCYTKVRGQMRLTYFLFISHDQAENDEREGPRDVGEMVVFSSRNMGEMSAFHFENDGANKSFLMYKKSGFDSPPMIVIDGKGWKAEGNEFYHVDVSTSPPTIQVIPMKAPDRELGSSGLIKLTESIKSKIGSGELKLEDLPSGTEDAAAWATKIKKEAARFNEIKKEFRNAFEEPQE